ncbi:MAG: hypothetical protein HYU32_06315 [candidate division NC10 bacterium]|nr:hypothetical protein [candidate division NC10 bacterium]
MITSVTSARRATSRMWLQNVCHLRWGSIPIPTITSRDRAGAWPRKNSLAGQRISRVWEPSWIRTSGRVSPK